MNVRDLLVPSGLPVLAAPMYGVSGPELVLAAGRAGIVGAFPASNATSLGELDEWLERIAVGSAPDVAWAVNLVTHQSNPRTSEEHAIVGRHRVPIVIASLGAPDSLVDAVHAYGGRVFADVASVRHARRAAARSVDGLVLVAAGAGGHTGHLSPLAFVDAVRDFYAGMVVLGGGIATGSAVHAARVLGADAAYVGSAFIATDESLASRAYRAHVIGAGADDVVCSDAFTGVFANMLAESVLRAGIDLPTLVRPTRVDPYGSVNGHRVWHDIHSAGHGVGRIRAECSVAAVVTRLRAEYSASLSNWCQVTAMGTHAAL